MQFPALTWHQIIESRLGGLGTIGIDRAEAERAFEELRSFFGGDPMALPIPVLERLTNAAPWTYEWLLWFANSLRRLAATQGYAELCSQLRDTIKYGAACTVLQVAERLEAVGLEVGFDIPAVVDGRKKIPDIWVRDAAADLSFYAEVSVMFTAQGHVDASVIFDRIVELFFRFYDDPMRYAGRILRPIAAEEVEGLIGRVWWEILEARRHRSLREVAIADTIILALAPEALAGAVNRWAENHKFEPGSFGAELPPVDEFMRLHHKIGMEGKQLPPDRPNLLVIWAQKSLRWPPEADHSLALYRAHRQSPSEDRCACRRFRGIYISLGPSRERRRKSCGRK